MLAVVIDFNDVTTIPYEQRSGSLVRGPSVVHSGNNLGRSFGARGMQLLDWDGDGDLDLAGQIELGGSASGRYQARFFENTGSLRFAAPSEAPVPAAGKAAGASDFDGDGNVDFCGAASIVFGDGTFDSQLPILDARPDVPKTEDLDGDGDLDLRDARSRLYNDGTGTFVSDRIAFPDPGPGRLYRGDFPTGAFPTGDFDGDGRTDLLIELWDFPGNIFLPQVFLEMRILAGAPDGSFVDVGTPAAAPGVRIDTGLGTRAGDFDLDGDLDLISRDGLWTNDGTGVFSLVQSLGFDAVADVGDVEPDGDLDVLVRRGDDLSLLQNDLGGAFTQIPIFTQNNVSDDAALVDLDGDGDLDLASPSLQPLFAGARLLRLVLAERLPNGRFAYSTEFTPRELISSIAVDDVDGDGLGDLCAASSSTPNAPHWTLENYGFIHVYRRTGPGLTYEPARLYFGHLAGSIADVDSDGDLDVTGSTLVRGTRFSSPAQGRIRQYGSGSIGTGGAVPLLGAQGPAKTGSTSYELRVRHALGGAPSALLIGTTEASIPNFPLPNQTLYVGGAPVAIGLVVGGTPGSAGAGTLTIPATQLPTPGTAFFMQTWHLDPGAANSLSHSNGLEVTYGQ